MLAGIWLRLIVKDYSVLSFADCFASEGDLVCMRLGFRLYNIELRPLMIDAIIIQINLDRILSDRCSFDANSLQTRCQLVYRVGMKIDISK